MKKDYDSTRIYRNTHKKRVRHRLMTHPHLLFWRFFKNLGIENAESYVFSIINVNKIPSPRGLEMRDTVVLIIENFFNMNEAALL